MAEMKDRNESTDAGSPPRLLGLLRLRLWMAETIRPSELHETLFWAGVVGLLGAVASVLFRRLSYAVHLFLTGQSGGVVESFIHLPLWQRALTPTVGGLVAGAILYWGSRLARSRHSTDYMEAIVVGNGLVAVRSSLVKSASALFSIAGGGSIGREGPMVQLSAMIASLVGRFRHWSTPRRRLISACGGAAGIASAYNAPIAGALFIAEIVLGSVAMESFGPLVFSSVVATLTVRKLMGAAPLYEIPPFVLSSVWEILPTMALGVVAGFAAPWFLRTLRNSERLFTRMRIPLYLKLGLGGAVVGGLAVFYPQVCGNGYSTVSAILGGQWMWRTLILILVFKVAATAATFGSGAVGGVFTPTLFVGACLGYLFGHTLSLFWPNPLLSPSGFALLGMGAFLAGTTHAPIMAIIMIFELTLDYQLMLPLMLACVISYYVSRSIEPVPIYSEALERKGAALYGKQLSKLQVKDLMRSDPLAVRETARFREIAQSFLTNNNKYLYVVDDGGLFQGVIPLHDIKQYLTLRGLADVVIARDILHREFPLIRAGASLSDALRVFSEHDGERLPVVDDETGRVLLGSISKRDLLLALAVRTKPFLKMKTRPEGATKEKPR